MLFLFFFFFYIRSERQCLLITVKIYALSKYKLPNFIKNYTVTSRELKKSCF